MRTPSTTGRTLSSPASPPRCRIPTHPAPSADPASPTSASVWSLPSPPSRILFIADTNFSATSSTTGRFRRSSTTAADVRSTPPSRAIPTRTGNDLNDRLPGYSRNAFTGPDYATADLRLTRTFRFGERYKLNLVAESFNLFNRDNQRVTITSNGMVSSATTFVQSSVTANIAPYPGLLPVAKQLHEAERGLCSKANPAGAEVHLLSAGRLHLTSRPRVLRIAVN